MDGKDAPGSCVRRGRGSYGRSLTVCSVFFATLNYFRRRLRTGGPQAKFGCCAGTQSLSTNGGEIRSTTEQTWTARFWFTDARTVAPVMTSTDGVEANNKCV